MLLVIRAKSAAVLNHSQRALCVSHAAVQQCLERWAAMPDEQRAVVIQFGWQYYDMDAWHQRQHGHFPAHLREQAVAVVLAIDGVVPRERGRVASMLTGAIDTRKREREFVLY